MLKVGEVCKFKLKSIGSILDGLEGSGKITEVKPHGYVVCSGKSVIFVSLDEVVLD